MHQWKDLGWAVLNRVGKLVVVKTNVAKVDLKLVLLEQEVGTKFVTDVRLVQPLKYTASDQPTGK